VEFSIGDRQGFRPEMVKASDEDEYSRSEIDKASDEVCKVSTITIEVL
jgi:hypothetical protein